MTDLMAPPDPTTRKHPGWTLTWRGRRFHDSDLTGRHLSTLAILTGTDQFDTLDISPVTGHQRLMFMIAAFLAVDAADMVDTSADDAEDQAAQIVARAVGEVSHASADEILGALTIHS